MTMSVFSETEIAYLEGADGEAGPRLARIATVGKNGTPHVTPVGWSFDGATDTLEVGGINLEQTKKFRDVVETGRAAIVIDDLASVQPWRPRGIEVRGSAEAVLTPRPMIRIHPERIISWGMESDAIGERHARSVER
jgi:pyridoxamine 5'-phosphate oxidase family protein